jgi:hypothetical protein
MVMIHIRLDLTTQQWECLLNMADRQGEWSNATQPWRALAAKLLKDAIDREAAV